MKVHIHYRAFLIFLPVLFRLDPVPCNNTALTARGEMAPCLWRHGLHLIQHL
jgi:hypothetical protein